MRCEEQAEAASQELTPVASKKLKGEAKLEYRRDILQRLVSYDPVIGAAMTAQSRDDK